MSDNNTEVATLSKSAEGSPPFNGPEFSEADLAKILSRSYADNKAEDPKAKTAIAEEATEEAIQDATKPDVDASSEDPEAHSQPEEETESETSTEEDQTEAEPSRVQKRIDQLTAQKKEALERADSLERSVRELEQRLTQTQEQRPTAPPIENRFADVWDPGKLAGERVQAKQIKRWCEDNPDGVVVGEREYSAADIRNIKRKVEDAIEDHIPARENFLRAYQQIEPVAQHFYPYWKDSRSAEYAEAMGVLREFPQIAGLPEHKILISDFIAGRNARLKAAAEKAKPPVKVVKPAPKQPSAPSTQPAKTDSKSKQEAADKARFFKSGDVRDLEKLVGKF